ncbi:MAG: hypothetical protein K0V04_16730 [Deltaproteobacteria bacterium]|nr:hypothetical protein [Deltaproteobacteria bacterium]
MRYAKAWVTTNGQTRVTDVSGLEIDPKGWIARVAEVGGTVTLRVIGSGSSQSPIVGVRSVSPPTATSPAVTVWTAANGEFVSPAFVHGDEFRIEVSTADEPTPVPVGGGYFRVVEEGGG